MCDGNIEYGSDMIAWVELAIDPLKKIWKFFLLKNYKRTSANPPLAQKDSKEIAYATLAGQIEKVISYRNIDSKKNYIVVFYKPNKEVFNLACNS